METDDYRDLLDECRRLRRERDELAKMCKRLVDELAAATFGGRLEPAPEQPRRVECIPTVWNAGEPCPACRSVRTFVPADEPGRGCLDCGNVWGTEPVVPECPCGSPAVTVRPTLMGQTEPACEECAAEPEPC